MGWETAVADGGAVPSVDDPSEAFGQAAFAALLRSQMIADAGPLQEIPDDYAEPLRLTLNGLDGPPTIALAWIYGIHARLFGQLPGPEDLVEQQRRLELGHPPEALIAELIGAGGPALRPDIPEHPQEIFVTGAYLCAFGRLPDEEGLGAHGAAMRAGVSAADVLGGLLDSTEGGISPRFPPEPQSRDTAVGRAIQVAVTGSHNDAVTAELAGRYSRGEPLIDLVRSFVQRGRSAISRLRTPVHGPELANQVQASAAADLLHREIVQSRRWQWRVDRRTWEQLDRIERSLGDLSRRLDRLAEQQGATPSD